MRKISVFLLLLLVSSCWTSKKTTEDKFTDLQRKLDSVSRLQQTTRIDTVETFTDRVVVDEVETVLRVPIDCDSLGNVTGLNTTFTQNTGVGSTSLSFEDGELLLTLKTDSIVQVFERQYRAKYVKDSIALVQKIKDEHKTTSYTSSETVITKRSWLIIALLAIIAIAIILRAAKPKWFPF